MKYMLAFYETAETFAHRSGPDAPAYWGAWKSYMDEMNSVVTSGSALQGPETGSTLRVRDARTHVQDGPSPDSKEMLGGFVVIDVPDLDAALAWAKKAPCAAAGAVGVYPVLPMAM
ncbi:MAG: hypothetical protein IV100_01685 [Myxococcales bacterium]|nr:hypothetical protein [Myxococcales bacterium]